MKKFSKKAFTLVELLVVIAIIAILAVAGVVGYMAFTKKAEVNNDTSLVAELNNYVAAASATDKINTPTDIRNLLIEDGIDLATLRLSAAKQGYIPGFDLSTKRFVLIKDNALAEGYTGEAKNIYAFAKTAAEAETLKANGFSLYLQSGFDATSIDISGLGLDVGENTGITAVNYSGTTGVNNVVIRTNTANTNLTIDAVNDTVNHYGSVGNVNALNVDLNNCYNEYGKAAYVKITVGKVVAKAGGTISVVFAANNDATKVAVIKEEMATITKGLTVIQPVSDTNEARTNGIPLEYSIDGATAASMSEQEKAAAIATREVEVNEQAEAAVEANIIEEIEESGLYETRIGTTGYATFDEAASAVLAGQTIVLTKDIVRVETVSVAVWDKAFNIDLNGHTYETKSDVDVTLGNNGYKASAFCFAYDGTTEITIKNGTIKTKYGAPVYAAAKTVVLENVVLYQDHNNYVQTSPEYSSAVRSTGGAVIINSGTFEGYYVLAASNTGGEYVVNGGTFNGALFFSSKTNDGVTKSFTIKGGTFNNFSVINPTKGTVVITGGTFDADPSAYVSSGYHATNNGDGTWTVSAD